MTTANDKLRPDHRRFLSAMRTLANGGVDREALADRLWLMGEFEIYRGASDGPRSAQVWLTEAERDEIVAALRVQP